MCWLFGVLLSLMFFILIFFNFLFWGRGLEAFQQVCASCMYGVSYPSCDDFKGTNFPFLCFNCFCQGVVIVMFSSNGLVDLQYMPCVNASFIIWMVRLGVGDQQPHGHFFEVNNIRQVVCEARAPCGVTYAILGSTQGWYYLGVYCFACWCQ